MSETKASANSSPKNPLPAKGQGEHPDLPARPTRTSPKNDTGALGLPHAPDSDVSRRPGNPKEQEPRAVVGSHWHAPERQSKGDVEILREPSLTQDSATFGTQHPPRGLSGIMRRAAYQLPDYRVKRWLLLIAADRLASAEWALSPRRPRTWLLLLTGSALFGGAYLYMRPRKRSWL